MDLRRPGQLRVERRDLRPLRPSVTDALGVTALFDPDALLEIEVVAARAAP